VVRHSGVQDDGAVLCVRLVRMVRKRRRRMPPTEVPLLSKGWRGAEQLVVGKVWMNTEAEGIEEVTY